MSEILVYRGIISDEISEAYKIIRNPKNIGARSFGSGVYFTSDPNYAKEYGNFVFAAKLRIPDIKLEIPEESTYVTTYKTAQTLDYKLMGYIDYDGINTKFKFHPKDWKTKEILK